MQDPSRCPKRLHFRLLLAFLRSSCSYLTRLAARWLPSSSSRFAMSRSSSHRLPRPPLFFLLERNPGLGDCVPQPVCGRPVTGCRSSQSGAGEPCHVFLMLGLDLSCQSTNVLCKPKPGGSRAGYTWGAFRRAPLATSLVGLVRLCPTLLPACWLCGVVCQLLIRSRARWSAGQQPLLQLDVCFASVGGGLE